MVYFLPFWTISLSPTAFPSVSPPVRPGYDDKYQSRSYRLVERQKRNIAGAVTNTPCMEHISPVLSLAIVYVYQSNNASPSKSRLLLPSTAATLVFVGSCGQYFYLEEQDQPHHSHFSDTRHLKTETRQRIFPVPSKRPIQQKPTPPSALPNPINDQDCHNGIRF